MKNRGCGCPAGWKQTLPLFDSRDNLALYTIALPHYGRHDSQYFSATQLNQTKLNSDLMTDVNAMAQYDLSERMPAIIIRQALRVWAKDELRRNATNEAIQLGSALVNIWNTLTEQPDTRSWLTLPGQIKSSSMIVEPGQQTVTVNEQDYQFELKAGRSCWFGSLGQGGNAIIWYKQLGNIR